MACFEHIQGKKHAHLKEYGVFILYILKGTRPFS